MGGEGSGSWISLRALNATSRAYDGRGPNTTLVKIISEYFDIKDLLEIITYVYGDIIKGDISRIAGIAKIVDEEASKRDNVSRLILVRAGKELANAALSVINRLKLSNKQIIVGEVGSVFRSEIVRKTFESEMRKNITNIIIRGPYIGPQALLGCAVYALPKKNVKINEYILEPFRKELSKMNNK